jgi:hypothetical protein
MHIVGARFADLDSANAALGEIRASVAVPRGDVAVRPLGSTRYEAPAADFLLAGRFPEGDVDAVLGIVLQHGGTLLSKRVDWPRSTITGGAGTTPGPGSSRVQRGGPIDRHGAQASRTGATPASQRGAHRRLRRPAALVRVRAARDRRFSA